MQNILSLSGAVEPGEIMEEAYGISSPEKKAENVRTEPTEPESCLATLTFPHHPPQSKVELVDITPEIKWLRMPMPYALDHVNVYLLRVERGWVIIDSGLDSSETRSIWEEVFSGPLRGEVVVGIFCTHFHVDHMGLAGYLTERWRIPLFTTYEEYFSMRGWPANLEEVPWQHAEFFQRTGFPKKLLAQTLAMFRFSAKISALPPAFIRLQEGCRFPTSGGDWLVIIGQGHSPEHAMLFSSEQKILVSGDQLLPRISTNVSVSAVNPEDEPLSRWLASLDRLNELPDDILVLPGHGLPFRGAKTRIEELRLHHERKFAVVLDSCAGQDLSAYELVQTFYPNPLSEFDLQLAMGECLAHVRYLLVHERLKGQLDGHGVIRYRTLDRPDA